MEATSTVRQEPGPEVAQGPKAVWWRAIFWVPTLYLAMGIPFNVIMGGTATRMYKSLGFSDHDITVSLGSVGLAWSLKPLWAAFLDMYRTKKFFVLTMEVLLGLLFCTVAMALPLSGFFKISIAIFWVAAFASSTQDICADGVYITSLDKASQARWAGLQGMFWVLGKVLATGVLISVMDKARVARDWSQTTMWTGVMLISAAVMFVFAVYHFFILPSGSLPKRAEGAKQDPAADADGVVATRPESAKHVIREFAESARSFFDKRAIWGMIAFVYLYRLGEGLILMEGQLFLQSTVAQGGLGLTAGQVSEIDAVYGTVASIIGGLLGGLFASKLGLKRSLVILALCLNVPHFTYVYLSQGAAAGHGLPYGTIVTMVSIEKFGYGFGFVGNMIYMMQQLAPGRFKMTHYAFATSLMNLVLIPTNMVSGPLAQSLGFKTFFVVVMFASVPSVLAAWLAPFPQESVKEQEASVDDESRLNADDRAIQRSMGRSSIYAMCALLFILILDVQFLGMLDGARRSSWIAVILVMMGAGAVVKGVLAWEAVRTARQALVDSRRRNAGEPYRGNGIGAMIAAGISVALTVALLAFAVNRSMSIDWACAGSENPDKCWSKPQPMPPI
jgi:MFS transporter, PAT family, beta-lactamase induction signal transducer AmpG